MTREEALAKLAEIKEYLESLGAVAVAPTSTVVITGGLTNPDPFWNYIRGDKGELFPEITQSQVDGTTRLLGIGAGRLPLSWMAYLLATAYHETARRMQPVKEGLDVSDAWRKQHLSYYPWYGRGDVQLTWEKNYAFATTRLRELGVHCDLVADADQALDPFISANVICHGMLEGWFTKKKLRDYIPAEPTRQHYVNARRIINGTDKADLIAGYAVEFEKALRLGEWR